MFTPRKSIERTKSTPSTASLPSPHPSPSPSSESDAEKGTSAGDVDQARSGPRKKKVKGIWPSSKTEPVSGISTAKAQSQSTPSSGQSASSTMSAVHQASPLIPFTNKLQTQTQKNEGRLETSRTQSEALPILALLPMTGAFQRKCIRVPYFPEVLRIGRQTNAKTVPTTINGYFDSKVLSRQHAVVWADANGRIWIRDVKSSNGTFVNGLRLSSENRDSEPHELREHDTLELGIDIVSEDQKSIVHHKVSAKVEQAGIYNNGSNLVDLNSADWNPSSGNGLMSPMPGKQMTQIQERGGNQSLMGNNGRITARPSMANINPNGTGAQWEMNSWINSITIEQVFKKLTTEIKQAKRQTQDLHRTSTFFSTLLSLEPGEEHLKWQSEIRAVYPHANGVVPPVPIDAISPFSQPPAPPPQRPLPEKPDLPDSIQESSKKGASEKVKSARNLPIRPEPPSSHILSLVEALAVAKREIDAQDNHLNHLEVLLRREREARESAEECTRRLMEARNNPSDGSQEHGAVEDTALELPAGSPKQAQSHLTNGCALDSGIASPSQGIESIMPMNPATQGTAELQRNTELADTPGSLEKFNTIVREMEEMRFVMESYKQRAEGAEHERNTLAKMVDWTRAAGPTGSSDASATVTALSNDSFPQFSAVEKSSAFSATLDQIPYSPPSPAPKRPQLENGMIPSDIAKHDLQERQHALSVIPQPQLQGDRSGELTVPYMSMVGVLLVGVGIMTWLNGWQKGER